MGTAEKLCDNQNPVSSRILSLARDHQPLLEGGGVKDLLPLSLAAVLERPPPGDDGPSEEVLVFCVGCRPSTSSAYSCNISRWRGVSDLHGVESYVRSEPKRATLNAKILT